MEADSRTRLSTKLGFSVREHANLQSSIMKTILNRSLRPVFALTCLLGVLFASLADAAVIDFTGPSSTAYADHFGQLSTGTFFSQQNGYLRGQQNSNFKGSALYETSPALFTAESVSLSAAITGPLGSSPSLLVYSRVNEEGIGFAARLLLVSSTNLRIILSYGHDATTLTGGTALLDWEYNVSTGGLGFYRTAENSSGASGTTGHILASDAIYQLNLESTSENEFRFTILNANGDLIASSGFQTSANLQSAVDPYGQVGFGGYAANSAGNTLRFYEFSVIPEPGTYALLAASGGLVIAASRLRRGKRLL